MRALDLPAHVGPCELSELGRLIVKSLAIVTP